MQERGRTQSDVETASGPTALVAVWGLKGSQCDMATKVRAFSSQDAASDPQRRLEKIGFLSLCSFPENEHLLWTAQKRGGILSHQDSKADVIPCVGEGVGRMVSETFPEGGVSSHAALVSRVEPGMRSERPVARASKGTVGRG